MTIIRYNLYNDIDVQFEDGTIVKNKSYDAFKKGAIKNNNVGTEYIKYYGKSKKCVVFGKEYSSFKVACEAFGLNAETVRHYKDKYKLLEEQAIDHYINGTDYSNIPKVNGVRINNFTKLVEIEGKTYNYKQAVKEFNLSNKKINKVMLEYNITDRGEAIVFCIKNNLAKSTRKQSGAIEFNGIHFDNITQALKYYKITTATYTKYKEKFNDDYIGILNAILDNRYNKTIKTSIGDFKSFKSLCHRLGFSPYSINNYADSNEYNAKLEAITKIVKDSYIQDNILVLPENIELNIKHVDVNKFTNLRRLCKLANINCENACAYKARHPELTDEEVVINNSTNCYLNIFGELVIIS